VGLRWIEKRLAAELCFEAVEQTVEDYLIESRAAGERLPPRWNLVRRIAATGYLPPGLFTVIDLMERYRASTTADAVASNGEPGGLVLPDADYLIEGIMAPYPIRRLRAYWARVHRQLRAYRMAEIMERSKTRHNAT